MAANAFGKQSLRMEIHAEKKKSTFSLRTFADSGYRGKSFNSNVLKTGSLLRSRIISRNIGNLVGTETKIVVLRTEDTN